MITRIMFVWFIKQKDLVPNRLFNVEYLQTILKDFDPSSTTKGNYYNAILQNLFFATLNRAIIDDEGNKRKFATATKKDIKTLYRYAELFSISEQEVIDLFADVPFLNGHLFSTIPLSSIKRASVFLSTLHIFAILRFDIPIPNSSLIKVSFPDNLYLSGALFLPLGRPKTTPSAFLRANASLVL